MHSPESQLATGQRFVGEITGAGDLQVDGRIEGEIRIEGRLTVGPDAVVLADVVAGSLHIEGRVEGRVRVATKVTIGQRGCLVGDVAGFLHVEEGGVFKGRLTSEPAPTDTQEDSPPPSKGVDTEGGSTKPEGITLEPPPVHFFDSAAPSRKSAASPRVAIRRLTEDDTLPPAPARPPAQSLARAPVTAPAEVPITRKQRIRTDTSPQQVPPPVVRRTRKPAREELDDPWFETEDESRDSK